MTRLTPHRPLVSAVILLAVVTLTGCAGASRASQAPAPQPEFQMGLEGAIARARADSLRYPYTQADIDFMSGMIHHHAQAIQMSRWASTHGARADVQLLAERIINAQQGEISLMQAWLQDWYGLAYDPQMSRGDMRAMERLASLSGADYEIAFMETMIRHHASAIREGSRCLERAFHGELLDLCENIIVTQSMEIQLMRAWLCDWYGMCGKSEE